MPDLGNGRRIWRVDEQTADLSPLRRARAVMFSARPQRVRIDLARTAILVVDMQNDFCSHGGWLDRQGVDIRPTRTPVASLRSLLPALRRLSVPVVWLNWGNRPDRLNLPPGVLHVYNPTGTGTGLGDRFPDGDSRTLEQGSWGAAVIEDLDVGPGDTRVDKYRMSGFWDTALDSILRNLDVRTLLFAGVNIDQCVLATLTDAACLGYDCLLVEDCCATTSPDYCRAATVYNVVQCFGFATSSADILQGIKGEDEPGHEPDHS